jgi:hypothetical protein
MTLSIWLTSIGGGMIGTVIIHGVMYLEFKRHKKKRDEKMKQEIDSFISNIERFIGPQEMKRPEASA